MQERSIPVTQFYDICEYCGKEIIGYAPESVRFNMEVHVHTQHKKVKK